MELVVERLQHPRHGAEPVGVTACQVALDGSDALGIVDADAQLLVFVVHGALVAMAEGKEAEHLLLMAVDLADGVAVGIEGEVAVGEHDALREACGARRVDDGSDVVGRYGSDVLFDYRAVLLGVLASCEAQLAHAGHHGAAVHQEDVDGMVGSLDVLLHLLVEGTRPHEDSLRVAVVEDVLEVVPAEGGVDGNVDQACQRASHIEEVPLGAVGGDGDDLILGAVALRQKAVGCLVGGSDVVVDTVFRPNSTFADSDDIFLGEVFFQVLQIVESSGNYHIELDFLVETLSFSVKNVTSCTYIWQRSGFSF